jgi:hypothetical protein
MGKATLTPFKIGEVFGRLTIVNVRFTPMGRATYRVKCLCGSIKDRAHYNLSNGDRSNKSCGCFIVSKTHGLSESRIKTIWKSMLRRCLKKNHKAYKYYGGVLF